MNFKIAAVVCFLSACSSHTEAPRKAAADLEGAAQTGMSYLDLSRKVQDLSAAIALAKREGASERALRPYVGALAMYMDSLTLWKVKLDKPAAFQSFDEASASFAAGSIGWLAEKYGVPYKGASLDRAYYKARAECKECNTPYPTYEVSSSTRDVFDKLMSAIWKKAEQKSKEKE